MTSHGSDSDSVNQERKRRKRKKPDNTQKKRRINTDADKTPYSFSLDPLLYPPGGSNITEDDLAFDETIEDLLPDLLQTRLSLQRQNSQYDDEGSFLRPLTRSEISSFVDNDHVDKRDVVSAILMRKMKLSQERRRVGIHAGNITTTANSLTKIQRPPDKIEPKTQVLSALQDIKTTPFECSFLSRLQGTFGSVSTGLIAVDWETVTPWMDLMKDIRDHYSLAHPERPQPIESLAPITYTYLQACHLDQIHDLLQRVFWTGIDVSDSLEYSPERCTVVATYKQLVVGVAILSSPQETYITYLAVKAGWDKAQIARTMLFHLIQMNPKRDITLHVSANNSAMLLYNQFGFKAEEFVAGFYEDYLDPVSRASKNALRLRLRQ